MNFNSLKFVWVLFRLQAKVNILYKCTSRMCGFCTISLMSPWSEKLITEIHINNSMATLKCYPDTTTDGIYYLLLQMAFY